MKVREWKKEKKQSLKSRNAMRQVVKERQTGVISGIRRTSFCFMTSTS